MERGSAGSVELDARVFEARVRPHLLHAEVRRQLARRRVGTHSTKNRHEVSGGGAKPWRQKGTGHARQGSRRSPQWAGGGVVFGPVPRDYEHALNKRQRRAALCGALSLRREQGTLHVVDTLAQDAFGTKRMAETLRGLGFDESRGVLVVLQSADATVERSIRNLPWARVLRVEGLNVYDVLRCPNLLLTRGALEALERRLTAAPHGAGGEEAQ